MSRQCPECNSTPAWRLADGRWKCRRCGTRYRRRSVWDAQRISGRDKARLLEFFVLGVPAYRLRFRMQLSAPTIEKFYRLVRSCMALEEHCLAMPDPVPGTLPGPQDTTMPGFTARQQDRMVLHIAHQDGQVRIVPLAPPTRLQAVGPQSPGSFMQGPFPLLQPPPGLGVLERQGERYMLRKLPGPGVSGQLDGIQGFWSFATRWLYPNRGIPAKNLALCLGEICFRFNHRDQDLYPLLLKLLHATPLESLRLETGPVCLGRTG